jgi:hypothetical protein
MDLFGDRRLAEVEVEFVAEREEAGSMENRRRVAERTYRSPFSAPLEAQGKQGKRGELQRVQREWRAQWGQRERREQRRGQRRVVEDGVIRPADSSGARKARTDRIRVSVGSGSRGCR